MKQGLKALALMVALTVGGSVIAADAPPPGGAGATETPKKPGGRAPGIRGKVTGVDGKTIKVAGRQGAEQTVTVDDNTKFTLDGKEASIKDVKADLFIMASPATGTATEVKLSTTAPQRKPKPGAPAEAPKAPETPPPAK